MFCQRSLRLQIAPVLLTGLATSTAFAGGDCATNTHCTFLPMQPIGLTDGDRMGDSVALEGKLAVIGAPEIDTVFVYRRDGGMWNEAQRIEGPADSLFGFSVDIDRGRILVGAPGADSFVNDSGRAYLFRRQAGSFVQAQELFPQSPSEGAQFGFDVAMDGPWIAAGEPWQDFGSVDLFRRTAGTYLPFSTLYGLSSRTFGFSLAMDDQDLIVGDPNDSVIEDFMGAGHQYRFDGASVSLVQKFRPAGLAAGDRFGIDVAVDGDRMVVGANGDDEVALEAGAAYIYDRGAIAFQEDDKVVPCEAQVSAFFGTDVAISGVNVAVGAGNLESVFDPGGRTFLFRPNFVGVGWLQTDVITPITSQQDDFFGASVAIDGPHLLVGAPGADITGNSSGTAYIVSTTQDSIHGGECPCEVLAVVENYGEAVPGSLGLPELEVYPMVVGENNLIALRNVQQGTQGFLWIGENLPSGPFHPRTPMGVGTSLMPFPAAGFTNSAGLVWSVPEDFALCGTEVHAVAFFFDPGAPGPLHIGVTNYARAIIGY